MDEELKIINQQHISSEVVTMLSMIYQQYEPKDIILLMTGAYAYGFIQGKRQERARRNKTSKKNKNKLHKKSIKKCDS